MSSCSRAVSPEGCAAHMCPTARGRVRPVLFNAPGSSGIVNRPSLKLQWRFYGIPFRVISGLHAWS